MPVINRIADFAPDMAAWRQHLHAHPELGLACHDTAAFVVERLRAFGITAIETGIATSGVVAVIDGQGAGPVVGLRADMDALPIEEATGVAYASTVPGRMHACGHDGHTAMLLGAARYLAETRNFNGRAVLIFQPAEETIGGGRIMVEEGIMERYGVDEVYALHTNPFDDLGRVTTCPGPIMASVDDFAITVTGQGGHAAYPHAARDPMPCALAIGQALYALVAREVDPLRAAVLSLTQVRGGTVSNVIPQSVTLGGTLRTLDAEIRNTLRHRVGEIVAGQAAAAGVAAQLDFDESYPVTVNHAAQTAYAADVARAVAIEVDDAIPPEMGSEDFSYMLEARPGAFLFLGQGRGASVHHPEFDFNDAAAPYGASLLARLVEARGLR